MLPTLSPLTALRHALAEGTLTPRAVAEDSIAHANGNGSHNTYLNYDPATVLDATDALPQATPLYAVPISLKDCFEQAGTVMTAGTRFYAEHNSVATEDSAMAERLKHSGALITGKTHLHPLAYGITGQNPDFGDCLQPRDATLLTGGSSSGAAASVQEGSALAAIGTDTGGSIRVPAALCGLVGFRCSHSIASTGIWRGGMHLAQAYDTPGILLRDPRDVAPIVSALFNVPPGTAPAKPRIGTVPLSFLHEAKPEVLAAYAAFKEHFRATGAYLEDFDAGFWTDAPEIYLPIQAAEAAVTHRGHFEEFGPLIAQRLHSGVTLTPDALASYWIRLAAFRFKMASLLAQYDFLMLPTAPIARLLAADDHTHTRAGILRYTAPFSLAGLPVLTLPGEMIGAGFGTGIQLAAAQNDDGALLAVASEMVDPWKNPPNGRVFP